MNRFPLWKYILIAIAVVLGSVIAAWSGKRVAMTDMPQMIALYNGMGGGAAGAIAAVELFGGEAHGVAQLTLGVLGGIIGAVSFTGSRVTALIAVRLFAFAFASCRLGVVA